MEREQEWAQTSTGDDRAQDKERLDYTRAMGVKEVMTREGELGAPGMASDQDQQLRPCVEGVDVLERNPKGSVSMQSHLQGRGVGNGEAIHGRISSSSSSSCPSPSALLSSLSLSSSSPPPSFALALPPSLTLDSVLVDGSLVLDVYQRGAAMMPSLWESARGKMKRVQYVRLGSEDEEALEGALGVLPHLTQLRSLAIRGTHTYIDMF